MTKEITHTCSNKSGDFHGPRDLKEYSRYFYCTFETWTQLEETLRKEYVPFTGILYAIGYV